MKKKIILLLFICSISNQIFAINQEENVNNQVKNYIMSNCYDKQNGMEIYDVMKYFCKEYEVDENLVASVMKVESNFNHKAVSSAGAIGLMQLMPTTADTLGVNPHDIFENVKGGVQYLKKCLNLNNGDLALALASYNAGYGAVQKYKSIPPYEETQNYIQKVLQIYNSLTNGNYKYVHNKVEFDDYGLSPIEFEDSKDEF